MFNNHTITLIHDLRMLGDQINNIDSLTGRANITRSKEIDGGEMQFDNEKLLLGDYPYDSLESIINDKKINCKKNYINYEKQRKKIYERYVKFIKDNGGDPELFSFRCIKEIINNLINHSVLKKDINNYSPIYYKLPNDDGTFDICGSKNGKDIDVCYKMTRFSEFILLIEYRIESIDSNTKRANISMKKYIIDNLHKDSFSPNTIEDKIILPGDYPCDKLINIIQEKQIQLEEDYKIIFNIFNNYKNYIKNNGGNTKYFDFYSFQEILINIIKNGNLSEVIEGRSPLYYKLPNDNGSFDICGSKNGKYIDIYYKMFLLYPDTFVTMYKIESIDSKTGRVTISEYSFTIEKNGGTWSVHKPKILPGDYPIDALNDIKEFEKAKKETGRTLKL